MDVQRDLKVAVLLSTYNGARFVEAQVQSLRDNAAKFALHWLDDHSEDRTGEVVRSAAASYGIDLREHHQPGHLGVPGTFFTLLEYVGADIYLFCDQDDVWQPGKIDAIVANLLPDIQKPVLCFSDALLFDEREPGALRRFSEVYGASNSVAMQESRALMCGPAAGHVIGFTRALREIFLRHREIARDYALMHDRWMYLIAVASGEVRLLANVPTTLYRRHGGNWGSAYAGLTSGGIGRVIAMFRVQQVLRRSTARQAQGFLLAARTLLPGPKLERLVEIAELVAQVDRRQSPFALVRLVLRRALWPNSGHAFWFSVACLCVDARR